MKVNHRGTKNSIPFLAEDDLDILNCMANGLLDVRTGSTVGLTADTVRERIYKMQRVFGATTRAHLAIIAAANDLIGINHLYDATLAEAVFVRNHEGDVYRLLSLRRAVVLSAAGVN